ncbi:MAG: HEAT repeat domain-containing protein, partial [Planctomycetota bacterium]
IAPGDPSVVDALIKLIDRETKYEVGATASDALGSVGPPAVPRLMRALRGSSSSQKYAAKALAVMGPDAEPAIPTLVSLLPNDKCEAYSEVAEALAAIGPSSAPAVVAAIERPHFRSQLYAGSVMEKLGPDAAGAVPALVQFLSHPDGGVRKTAAEALSHIKLAAEPAVPGLRRCLSDNKWGVRWAAGKALEGIGPTARPAIRELKAALRDEHPWVREWAVRALGNVDRDPADALPIFVAALSDDSPKVQSAAADMLGRLGPRAASAAPSLATLLGRSKDEEVRRCVVDALRCIRSDDPDVMIALARVVPKIHAATSALVEMGDKTKSVIPHLVPHLEDGSAIGAVTHILKEFGRDAEPATRALLKALVLELDRPRRGSADIFRCTAGPVLSQIGAPAAPGLARLLGHKNKRVRLRALQALHGMSPGEAASTVPSLVSMLKRVGSERRRASRRLKAAKDGPDAAAYLLANALAGAFSGRSDEYSVHVAIRTLSSVGPQASQAARALRKIAETKGSIWTSMDAAEAHGALANIAGDRDAHVKALVQLMLEVAGTGRNPDRRFELRQDKRNAIAKIIADLGRPGEAALVRLLSDDDAAMRRAACTGLCHAGKADSIPFETVMRCLANDGERMMAFQVIEHLGPKVKPVVPRLVELLDVDKWQYSTVRVLGRIGPDAREAVPPLIRLLRDMPADHGGDHIVKAVAEIKIEAAHVRGLVRLLEEETDYQALLSAVEILGGADHRAGAAVPHLLRLLRESLAPRYPRLREIDNIRASFMCNAAFQALVAIGPGAEEAVPMMEELVRSGHYRHLSAIHVLAAVGPKAASATDELVRLLLKRDSIYAGGDSVRGHVCVALGSIGPGARGALPALQWAIHDKTPKVREAAREAIAAIGAGQ